MSFLQRLSRRSRIISADPSCLYRPRLRRRWFLLSLFCISLIAHAAASYTVQGNVYRVVEYVSSDANEIKVSTVVKGAAANEPYAARVVPIKQSRFASWFKPNLGMLIKSNLWWMGFAAIIESAGWAIEELKGQVQVVKSDPNYQVGFYWHRAGDPYKGVASTLAGSFAKQAIERGFSDYSKIEIKRGNEGWVYRANGDLAFVDWASRYSCSDGGGAWVDSCKGVPAPSQPVSDADLQAAINAQLAADPAHAATAFTDPATGRGYDDLFDPVPYIPGLSAADEALVNCFISGQLQMVNSQTACYVATQAEYDRVKQQAEALAAGKTPEAAADALNSQMKQPITQAQYEASNLKTESATKQAIVPVVGMDKLINPYDEFKTDVAKTPEQTVNYFPIFGFPRFGGGKCTVISTNFEMMGYHFVSNTSGLCDFYYSYLLPAFTALFYIITGFVIWLDVRDAIGRRV